MSKSRSGAECRTLLLLLPPPRTPHFVAACTWLPAPARAALRPQSDQGSQGECCDEERQAPPRHASCRGQRELSLDMRCAIILPRRAACQLCIGCAHAARHGCCNAQPPWPAPHTTRVKLPTNRRRFRALAPAGWQPRARKAARGSCDARKQRVYRRRKRSVTGMRSANSRIKSNCKGEGRGESVPSSFALSTAASTCSAAAA